MNDDEFVPPASTGRGRGRPQKGDAPLIDYDKVDKLLVYGELVATDDGKTVSTAFPSHRTIGEMFGVTAAVISDYSRKHNCMGRRERARVRTELRVEEKMVESRAEAIAVSKEHSVQIIDTFLLGFEKAISEGKVRFDNPTDYNTMARLKEFLLGGADSRQEVNAAISLDALQARHRDTRRAELEASPAERGELEGSPMRRAASAALPNASAIAPAPDGTPRDDEGR